MVEVGFYGAKVVGIKRSTTKGCEEQVDILLSNNVNIAVFDPEHIIKTEVDKKDVDDSTAAQGA